MTESNKILTAILAVVLLIGAGLHEARADWLGRLGGHITDWTRINVKVHNHADHPVLVRLSGESQIVAPKATFIFRKAGVMDRVIVHYLNPVTGESLYSDDLGIPLGNMSAVFGG